MKKFCIAATNATMGDRNFAKTTDDVKVTAKKPNFISAKREKLNPAKLSQ